MPIEKINPPSQNEAVVSNLIYDTINSTVQVIKFFISLLIETIQMFVNELKRGI